MKTMIACMQEVAEWGALKSSHQDPLISKVDIFLNKKKYIYFTKIPKLTGPPDDSCVSFGGIQPGTSR